MKGVIFSTSFFILICSVFLNLSYYINFDHNRSLINNSFKKGLSDAAYLINDSSVNNIEGRFNIVVEEVISNLPKGYKYNFELLGYNEDPILLRVKLKVNSTKSKYSFEIEESILEKEYADEEV